MSFPSRQFHVDVLSRSNICKVDNCLAWVNELQLFYLEYRLIESCLWKKFEKHSWFDPQQSVFLWIDPLCSKLSRSVKLHLFIPTRKIKSVGTELQQSLSLIICSTFELVYCWTLQTLSWNRCFVTLQKFYHSLATTQFRIQAIILVNLKRCD